MGMHELAGWQYRMRMTFAGDKGFWDVEYWHPKYGTLAVDSWGEGRQPGAVTAQYIAGHLWVGATEFLERTTGA